MSADEKDWIGDMAREHYNPPPSTPREEMWAAVEARLDAAEPSVVSIEAARATGRRVPGWRRAAWMAAAATVVLSIGIGLGRWSAIEIGEAPDAVAESEAGTVRGGVAPAGRLAAAEHLSRTEPLLALVKSDVARGSVDREIGVWARELLGQTRFLLESGLPMDPEVMSLMEDLELILLQAALVAEGEVDGDRAREELLLLGEGLEERRVLPRIQAVLPTVGLGLAGT